MTRHEQRYKAMTILYQAFLYNNNNINYNIEDIINEQMEEKSKFVNNLVMGVLDNKEELDNIANKYLDNITCIDEAVELSKEYSDEKVCKMINGVLDKVYNNKNND